MSTTPIAIKAESNDQGMSGVDSFSIGTASMALVEGRA
jgi:hypothetical protein